MSKVLPPYHTRGSYMSCNVPILAQKIIKMAQDDQQIRMSENPTDADMQKVDSRNRKLLKEIIKKHGLISISKFRLEVSRSAWLLVQHFPREEVSFMKYYLELMEQSKDDIDIKNWAYLKDRVAMYTGKPQTYGTQTFRPKGQVYNEFYPIENIENVDSLRRGIGLSTLKEYAQELQKMYDEEFRLPVYAN